MTEIEISSITFTEDGVAIQYIELPTDLRAKGALVLTHQIQLHASHPDYREDMERLHDRAVKAVRNALEDYRNSEPYEPPNKNDDDDERGMGE